MGEELEKTSNPLGTEAIGKLLPRFAIPSVISMLVNSLYNIVDQIFIGQGVGMYGNAATNVAFPLTTLVTAVGLMLGIGGAANFNLEMGKKNKEKARHIAGCAFGSLFIAGVIICVIVRIFLRPLLYAFGATPDVFDYALTYVSITSLGMPFFIIGTGGNHLVRADGSPVYSMAAVVSGAVINTILDPIFIFVCHWGIAGAAFATIIGQIFTAILMFCYLPRYKTVHLTFRDLIPRLGYLIDIARLGIASFFNQLALMVVQIVMNNVLRYYGGMSIYGSDIPLAVVGIVTKVNQVFLAIVIGISQGAQPIISFNYGAQQYGRVKRTYLTAATTASIIAVIAFLAFQILPRQIISLFGSGDELYYQFAVRYFRIFMFCTFLNGIQPLTGNFFTSIGQATRGIFISMTRQLIFLVPLILILPIFLGINGVMYAGPVADGAAGILAILFMRRAFWRMPKEEEQ